MRQALSISPILLAIALLLPKTHATTIPRLSFEELTDTSDLVISGRITTAAPAWDENHKYIWTHYQLSVTSVHKGPRTAIVEFAEPGGTLDGLLLSIPGSVAYQPGERVLIFLQRMPNGYLRTTGWGQGKYAIDSNQTLRADSALRGVDLVNTTSTRAASTSVRTLNGMSLSKAAAMISARVTRSSR